MSATKPKPVKSLGDFMKRVDEFREKFNREPHQELWFRGESFQYRESGRKTFLRPELYRPQLDESGRSLPLREIDDLLEIESQQYDSFQHSAVQLSDEKSEDENWDWDSYFLMQHHAAPTRLLDWSDGALIALHFAVHSRIDGAKSKDATVYVLDPDKLKDLPAPGRIRQDWKTFAKKHPTEGYSESEWECAYLPHDKKTRRAIAMPSLPNDPLVLEFPHITRRVAAQRSRFVVFGRDPTWLANKLRKSEFLLDEIVVDAKSISKIKIQLRDTGITESVIYPDLDGLGRELKRLWEDRKRRPPD